MRLFSRRKPDPELVAFEREALTHMDALYANALRLTKAPHDAEDLVQETFLRAHRFHDRFEQGSNLRAWLFRIQFNTFVNRYRRATKQQRILQEMGQSPDVRGVMSRSAMRALGDPDTGMLQPLVAREIGAALDALPEDQRTVVVLADVEEFSYREIAEIVGCPIGTVMSRLHRARRALQVHLLDQARLLGIVPPAADEAPQVESVDETGAAPEQREDGRGPVSLADYRRGRSAG